MTETLTKEERAMVAKALLNMVFKEIAASVARSEIHPVLAQQYQALHDKVQSYYQINLDGGPV